MCSAKAVEGGMVRSLGHYDGHTGIEGFDSPSIHAREGS